jgi:hypothetical protein
MWTMHSPIRAPSPTSVHGANVVFAIVACVAVALATFLLRRAETSTASVAHATTATEHARASRRVRARATPRREHRPEAWPSSLRDDPIALPLGVDHPGDVAELVDATNEEHAHVLTTLGDFDVHPSEIAVVCTHATCRAELTFDSLDALHRIATIPHDEAGLHVSYARTRAGTRVFVDWRRGEAPPF